MKNSVNNANQFFSSKHSEKTRTMSTNYNG